MSIRDKVRRVTNAAVKDSAEIALTLGIAFGWYFLTSAVSSLSFVRADVVWRVSAGLLLLSLCGWRLLYKIASRGLYDLTRD